MSPTERAAREAFERAFGRPADVVVSAPGRVNLIGEHTDYTGGLVMPMAIPQRTFVAVGRRDDRAVRAVTERGEGLALAGYALGREEKTGGWIDYVQGTTAALAARGFVHGGFDAAFASRVPVGAGLSSSAALELALVRGLRATFELAIDDVTAAKVGRAAETDFVGAPIGIMDQMASSLADERSALFLDTRSMVYETVALPDALGIVVIDSGVTHEHATGGYKTRRAECEEATRMLGVEMLRDVTDPAAVESLPEPLRRRARHVVTENARVLEALACLRSGDLERLGAVLDASHVSLRDDFEVSVPDVDRLVAAAQDDPDVLGARMTGGGFGGAIVALTRKGSEEKAATRIARGHGHPARVLVPDGGGVT